MKKLFYLIIVMVVLGLIVSGCIPVVPPTEKDEVSSLKQPGNGNGNNGDRPPSGAHYNLNIIGKKSDWNAQGSFDNPDRHTMFVPEDMVDYNRTADTPCYTPMGTPTWAPSDANYDDPRDDFPGITIWMTQGDEFAVLDGNAFDDCKLEFQLAPGKYEVWIVAKAKPPKPGTPEADEYYTDITGWVRYEDDGIEYVACDLGTLNVKKKLGWQDATNLFYFTTDEFGTQWVFDYLEMLEVPIVDGGLVGATDAAYFWQYDNHGNKLVKVRFYEN